MTTGGLHFVDNKDASKRSDRHTEPPIALPAVQVAHIREALLAWFASHSRSFPWRAGSGDPFAVLIAEVLLKRTTATAALRLFPSFMSQYPDAAALARATMEELELAVSTIGLQRQRAKALKEIAAFLLTHHGGRVPDTLPELRRIPNIGPYSARAIVSFAFGRPEAVVDSNVLRILKRLFANRLRGRLSLGMAQSLADQLLPPEYHQQFNWAWLDLGSAVCRPLPRCGRCPLARQCQTGALSSPGLVDRRVAEEPEGYSV